MMSRTLELTLQSLLPTCNAAFPAPLLELASSLLAQSRLRASTLKAEEEIARSYACAHIACNRLKITLDLPSIDPRPPIPPRVYKRVYDHLDRILPASSTPGRKTFNRVRTPKSKAHERELLGASSSGHPSQVSPSKGRSRDTHGTPASKPNTPFKLEKGLNSSPRNRNVGALPLWMKPTLRFLCRELDSAHIFPAIAAGIDSIVAPRGQRTQDEWVLGNLTPLLGALYLYVWTCIEMPDGLDEKRYLRIKKSLISALCKTRRELTNNKGLEGVEAWEGWQDVTGEDLDRVVPHVSQAGWLEEDWAQGISYLGQRREESAGDDYDSAGRGPNKAQGQVRKADAMFQDKYDYLSGRKAREYAVWKRRILKRIAELEYDPEIAKSIDL